MRKKSDRSPLKYEKLYDDWKYTGGMLTEFSRNCGVPYHTLKNNFERIDSERSKTTLLVVR